MKERLINNWKRTLKLHREELIVNETKPTIPDVPDEYEFIQHDIWLEQVRQRNDIYTESVTYKEDPRLKID